MPLPTLFVPEDKTGIANTNLIDPEFHSIPATNGLRIIKPNLCAYYTDSLIVRSISATLTKTILVRGIDYVCTDIFAIISKNIGKEICASILIKNSSLPDSFEIEYQAYGGFGNPNNRAIAAIVSSGLQSNPIDWIDIVNKPTRFQPAAHLHDWLDLYGLEYLSNEIDRIPLAIINKPTFEQINFPSKVNSIFAAHPITDAGAVVLDDSHLTNYLNVHNTTKQQIGLGNVQNYDIILNYTNIIPGNLPGSSYYADYSLAANSKYASAYSINKYTDESGQLLNNIAFGNVGSYLSTLNQQITNVTNTKNQVLLFTTANSVSISSFTSNVTTNVNTSNTQRLALTKFKLLNYYEELALTIRNCAQHKYGISQAYASLLDVPNKIPGLYLWIDFSDLSKITSSVISTETVISNIVDKSIHQRVFTQSNPTLRPLLAFQGPSGVPEINLNSVAVFNNNRFLTQSNGTPITLTGDCTIIALTRNGGVGGESRLLSSATSVLKSHGTGLRALELNTPSLSLKTPTNTSVSFEYALSVMSISNNNVLECWSANKLANSNTYPLGLDNPTKTGQVDILFNSLGDYTGSFFQNYAVAEIFIYNRQLSVIEIKTLVQTYMSYKWSGITFPIDFNFVTNGIQ